MAYIGNRKSYDDTMRDRILRKNECPFCDISAQKDHTLWKGKYWYILHNIYPYSGDEKHLMAVPYTHKAFSYELDPYEISELSEIYRWMKGFYGEGDYFSCTRETLGNRSIEHYHMHFLPGKLQWRYIRKMLELQGFPIVEASFL